MLTYINNILILILPYKNTDIISSHTVNILCVISKTLLLCFLDILSLSVSRATAKVWRSTPIAAPKILQVAVVTDLHPAYLTQI